MEILIPADKAIQILKTRLAEIDALNFNSQAWKDRTENDLKEIFPPTTFKWAQVSKIYFETYITADKAITMAKGKDTARQLLNSYIESIIEYSNIVRQKQVAKEAEYERKYLDLLKDWNDLVPEYNEIIKKKNQAPDKIEELTEMLAAKEQEIVNIRSETIQLDNVSFSKLRKVFLNLPVWQIVSTLTVVAAIISGCFVIGTIYQKNEDNTNTFELRTELQQTKSTLDAKDRIIEEKDKEIESLKSKPNNGDSTSLPRK